MALGCQFQVSSLSAQAVGGVSSWHWSVPLCICYEKLRLYVSIVRKESVILLSLCKGQSLHWKPTKCNAWNLSFWAGGWYNSQNLFPDEHVCYICVYCGMRAMSLYCYGFCIIMMMVCLVSYQSFTSLSLCTVSIHIEGEVDGNLEGLMPYNSLTDYNVKKLDFWPQRRN